MESYLKQFPPHMAQALNFTVHELPAMGIVLEVGLV